MNWNQEVEDSTKKEEEIAQDKEFDKLKKQMDL